MTVVNFAAGAEFGYESLDDAFPKLDPGIAPLGSRVLLQARRSKTKTKGGIVLPDEIRKTESSNTQVFKLIAAGPLAFHNRNTREPWPEGKWADVGDFVRAPKFGGDRFTVKHEDEEILFVIFNDLDLIGLVTDPLKTIAFV